MAATSTASLAESVLVVNREELLACSLPKWYNQFKEHTIESVFIPLSEDFVDYLLSDGLILPKECELPKCCDVSSSDSDDSWEDETTDKQEDEPPSFPELVLRISDGIRTLQGEVFPKLNWSSPKDATWIAPDHTLKCTVPGEIILLLKSSQFVTHDLSITIKPESNNKQPSLCTNTEAQNTMTCGDDGCGRGGRGHSECMNKTVDFEYMLCLRKWMCLRLSNEFRCFVWNHIVIAISQRHCDNYYHYLHQDRNRIIRDIKQFQNRHVAQRFPIKNYVMDLHLSNNGVVTLIDFNPFCTVTDSLLFSWEEMKGLIESSSEKGPVLKIVSDPAGIQPSTLHSFHIPKDFLDLSTGSDIHKLVDLLNKTTTKKKE